MRLLPVVPAFLLVAGCFQYEQDVVVHPDGSGKIVRTLAVKRATLNLIRALTPGNKDAQDPLGDFGDPAKLQEQSEGIVAWSKPERSRRQGWDVVRLTGYFEDIDKVRLYQVRTEGALVERTLEFACALEKEGGARALALDPTSRDAIHPESPAMKVVLPFLAEARIRTKITVPGDVEEASGFDAVEGRTATFTVDHRALQAAANDPASKAGRDLEALLGAYPRVSWRRQPVDPKERAAFRKELRAARAEWTKLAPPRESGPLKK